MCCSSRADADCRSRTTGPTRTVGDDPRRCHRGRTDGSPKSFGAGAATPIGSRPWFKSSQRILGRDWPTAYLFVLPTVLLLFGLIGYPFFRAVYLSFHNAVGVRVGNFVGLENYTNLWADSFFLRAVMVTVTFTFWSVLIKFILGLSTALLLHHIPRFGAVLGGLVLLPYIIPEVVRGLAWRVLLDRCSARSTTFWSTSSASCPRVALAGRSDHRLAVGHPGEHLVGPAVLHHPDGGRPKASTSSSTRPPRSTAPAPGASSCTSPCPGLKYVIIVACLLNTIFTFNGFTLTYILTGGGPGGATRIYTILAYEYAVQGLRWLVGRGGDDHGAGPLPPDPVPRPVHDEPRRRPGRPAETRRSGAS